MQISTRLATYQKLWSIHTVRWLFIARLFANIIFYSTVMVQYQASRGLNYTEMFALESIISAAAWAFEIPTGIWADRLGYRRVLILGYGMNIASLVIFITTRGFWPFAFASVLFGINLACLSGCEDALLYESLPVEHAGSLGTAAFSLLNAAQSAGFLVGLAVGSFMGTHDPALPFIISLIPLVLSFFAVLRLRPVGSFVSSEPGREVPRAASAGWFLRSALQILRKHPRLIGLSLLQNAAFVLTNAIFWYNQPYFTRASIPVAWFGPATAVAVGLGMVFVLVTPVARRRVGVYGALALSCIVPGIGFIALAKSSGPLLTLLFVAFVVAGSAWRQPIITDELNRHIEQGSRATTLSVLSFIGTLASIALNPLIGLTGDLGLEVTGVSLGCCLILLGLAARGLVR